MGVTHVGSRNDVLDKAGDLHDSMRRGTFGDCPAH